MQLSQCYMLLFSLDTILLSHSLVTLNTPLLVGGVSRICLARTFVSQEDLRRCALVGRTLKKGLIHFLLGTSTLLGPFSIFNCLKVGPSCMHLGHWHLAIGSMAT